MGLIKIIGIVFVILFLFTGCAKKSASYYKFRDTNRNIHSLTPDIHKQGYYNCINGGGSESECSRVHSYRP